MNSTSARRTWHCRKTCIPCWDQLVICGLYLTTGHCQYLVYIVSTFCYRLALKNFERCVKPGGLLLIDHRNYDHILDSGYTPSKCIYYNVSEKCL
jgi:hypothetical protein